jgi:hypothetical protein
MIDMSKVPDFGDWTWQFFCDFCEVCKDPNAVDDE